MVRANRTEGATVQRGVRRWVGVGLAATLLALTAAAMLGSWRQAEIASAMAAESTRTDAYQQASYLATLEIGYLQNSLRDPHGEKRESIPAIGVETLTALEAVAADDKENKERCHSVVLQRHALQPLIDDYLMKLDRDDTAAAQYVLEERIEPGYEVILDGLLAEQEVRIEAYARAMARAARDSRLLQVGTVFAFALGLAVLGLLGWSSRSHRRVVEQMAAHDPLTELPNRSEFHAHARAALARAKSGQSPVTVLELDLDRFKDVNDSLGHHIGDLLLVQVAQRLQKSVRAHDLVARLGGDEFAVLLTDPDPGVGEQVADRISQSLNNPFLIDDVVLDIEASIGIVTAAPDDDVATILRYADTAMYAAKEHRLGHTRFDPSQANETAARLTMLGDLRRALETDDEIELYYQPKVAIDTGEVIGAEALARWRHPTRGLVPPNEFIPVLEGTSLVRRFTARVLEVAMRQARTWLDAGHTVPVAVNVSTRCLLDTTFPDAVAQALRAAGVPGAMLCIEITENTVMANPEIAIDVLRRIRSLDVKTSIDDFGTGYSSMAYLKILPVDEIKIDRSFVRDMATDRSNYILVGSAVDLGHNLGLAVVAEGVENGPIVAALHELGCDVAQGYHFARPLPAGDFSDFLADHPVRQTVPS
jgi:diguanylate cyclase (GGDEF)-like protein